MIKRNTYAIQANTGIAINKYLNQRKIPKDKFGNIINQKTKPPKNNKPKNISLYLPFIKKRGFYPSILDRLSIVFNVAVKVVSF